MAGTQSLCRYDLGRLLPLRDLDRPQLTAREALLNAMLHRGYVMNASIQIELHTDRLLVTSLGSFVRGMAAHSLLRHAPERRNLLLAEVV